MNRQGRKRGAVRQQARSARVKLRLADSMRELRRWAGFATFGGVFALLGVFSFYAMPPLMGQLSQPISEIQFNGYTGGEFAGSENSGVSEEELLELAMPFLGGSYWDLSVDGLKQTVETHPWVRRATVAKSWPEKVWVGVDEHVPVARWNQDMLLSMSGEIFQAGSQGRFEGLPVFTVPWIERPSPDVVLKMVDHYNELQLMLSRLSLQIEELYMPTMDNLMLRTQSGQRIFLGTSGHMDRLQRLERVVEELGADRLKELSKIDLRYKSGVAIVENEVAEEMDDSGYGNLSGYLIDDIGESNG